MPLKTFFQVAQLFPELHEISFFLFSFLVVLVIELNAFHMPGKHSTT
jgi:hypothetical protein